MNGASLIYTLSNDMPQFPSTRRSSKPKKRVETPGVFITEIPHHTDPRIRTPEADKARALEVENLVRRGTWEMVLEENIPEGSFAKHLTHDLGMNAVSSDMSLFFRRARGQVTGLIAVYVDDTLACGDRSFVELTEKSRKAFEVKSREHDKMRFSGVYVGKLSDEFEIHHRA